MNRTQPRQPARAGDLFRVAGATVTVTRVSRHPDRPWVDVFVAQANGASWSKRMPTGIPASWERIR